MTDRAVCGRCQGKGTIQPFRGLEPSRCPVCLGTGWPKPPRRSSRPDPRTQGFIVLHSDDDPYDVIESLPWGISDWEKHG